MISNIPPMGRGEISLVGEIDDYCNCKGCKKTERDF